LAVTDVDRRAPSTGAPPATAIDGLRETEVGPLPRDWSVVTLGSRAAFRTGPFGSALHKSDYAEDGIPVINPIHIVGGDLRPSRTVTVTEQAARRLPEYRLARDDIVIARRGDMGRCAVVGEQASGWLCGTGSMIVRCADGVCPDFVQAVLSSRRSISALEAASVGTTMVNLNRSILAALKIQMPPTKEEQCAIAAVLSDAKDLIEAVDDLVEKMRAMKQGTMQQLLSGRARLPSFTGDWPLRGLGDVLEFLRTANNPRADLGEHGDLEYLHYGDVHLHSGPILDLKTEHLPRIDEYRTGRAERLRSGDLVMVDASEDLEGTTKSVEILNPEGRPVVAGLHTIACRGLSSDWALGFKAYLQFMPDFRKAAARMAAGISVFALSSKQVSSIELRLPPVPEQEAIVAVLTDMEIEIRALQERGVKLRALGHGISQALLTGKIRVQTPRKAPA